MATNELVVYEYRADTNQFTKSIDKAKLSEDKMSVSTEKLDGKTSNLGNTFKLVAGATGIALGVLSGAVFNTGLAFNAMQESTHKALTILLENETAASDLEKEMKKLADSSQFDLSAVNGLGLSLINAGVAAEEVPAKINDIMDAVGALGGSTAELETVTRAIGQMYSKGKISAEEMNQLAEAGIPGWQLLAETMGLSVAEVMKLGEEGKLTTAEIDLLVKAMGEKYEGGAAIDTFPEKLSNMNAQFAEFSGVIMQVLTPALTSVVDQLTLFFDKFDEGIPPEIIEGLKNVAIGIGAITLAVGSWKIAQIALRGTIFQTAAAIIQQGIAWAIAAWPITLLTIAIFLLGAAFIYAYKQNEQLRIIVSQTFAIIGTIFMFLMKIMIAGFTIMIEVVSQMWAIFGDELTAIFRIAFVIIGGILLLFLFLFQSIVNACQLFWELFGESITFIFQNVFVAIESILKIFQGFFQVIIGLLTGDWALMAEGFKNIWNGMCNYFIAVFKIFFIGPLKLILDLLGIDWETFVNFMKKAWELFTIGIKVLFEVFSNFFKFTIAAIQLWWETTCNFMKAAWELFTSGITFLFNGFKSIFDSVVNGIKSGWQAMTDFMMMLWDNSIGKMIEGIQNLASFAGDAFSKIPFVGGMFGGKNSLNVNNGFINPSGGSQGNSNITNNYNFEVKSDDATSMRQAYRSGRAMVMSDGGTL